MISGSVEPSASRIVVGGSPLSRVYSHASSSATSARASPDISGQSGRVVRARTSRLWRGSRRGDVPRTGDSKDRSRARRQARAPAHTFGAMIEVEGLTKRYGETVAVDGLTFTVEPGRVTGFVGPNGAGKSTTMRLILGLDAPDAGRALVGGQPYATLAHPLREVGSLLDAGDVHPGLRARDHLLLAGPQQRAAGLARARGA